MRKFSQSVAVVVLVLITACSMLPTHKDDLDKKNDDFMLRVRWLDFNGAAMYFDAEYRPEFIERYADLEDLKITYFDKTRIEVKVPEEKVVIHYLLEYYMLPSVTVKKKRFALAWEKSTTGSSGAAYWRIAEPFPGLP